MLGPAVRAALVLLGLGMMVVGILEIPGRETGGGLYAVLMGGLLVVIVVLERGRYRASHADGGSGADARFRRTDEVFVDPTSGARMRVLVDPATGERRYVADA